MTTFERRIENEIDRIAWNKMVPSTPIMTRQLFPEEWEQIRIEKENLRRRVARMSDAEKRQFVA